MMAVKAVAMNGIPTHIPPALIPARRSAERIGALMSCETISNTDTDVLSVATVCGSTTAFIMARHREQ